jgi:hypothetical protein
MVIAGGNLLLATSTKSSINFVGTSVNRVGMSIILTGITVAFASGLNSSHEPGTKLAGYVTGASAVILIMSGFIILFRQYLHLWVF